MRGCLLLMACMQAAQCARRQHHAAAAKWSRRCGSWCSTPGPCSQAQGSASQASPPHDTAMLVAKERRRPDTMAAEVGGEAGGCGCKVRHARGCQLSSWAAHALTACPRHLQVHGATWQHRHWCQQTSHCSGCSRRVRRHQRRQWSVRQWRSCAPNCCDSWQGEPDCVHTQQGTEMHSSRLVRAMGSSMRQCAPGRS